MKKLEFEILTIRGRIILLLVLFLNLGSLKAAEPSHQQNYSANTDYTTEIISIIIFICLFLAMLLFRYYDNKRKEKEEKEHQEHDPHPHPHHHKHFPGGLQHDHRTMHHHKIRLKH